VEFLMRMNRREFIEKAAFAALALGLPGTASGMGSGEVRGGTKESLVPIVDTHQHLWDLRKFRLRWVESSEKLNRSYVTRDYLAATRGLNVVKAVYMEVAVDESQLLAEAEHAIELSRSREHPTCAAVIGGRPATPGFREYIGRFRGNPHVKGVRQVLFSSPGLCLTQPFVESIRYLGELGMSFDICLPPAQLDDGAKLAGRCGGTRFIVDHCGNADPLAFRPGAGERSHDPERWRRDMETLAGKKNVVCKISGIVARAPAGWTAEDLAPIVNHCLRVFGPDRVFFGSDWPVCLRGATYGEWVRALKEIVRNRGEGERRKLFHDNAVRFYGLKR